jgi:hypothetical protein
MEDPTLIASLESAVNAAMKLFISNQILNAHAKKLHPDYEVVRVQGDGRCLFHALTVAMRALGIPCVVSHVKLEIVAFLRRVGLVDLAKVVVRNDYAGYDERIFLGFAYTQAVTLRVLVDNEENGGYHEYSPAGAMANWVDLPFITRESQITVVIVNRLNATPLHFDAVTRDEGGAPPDSAAGVEVAGIGTDSDSGSRSSSSSSRSGSGVAADEGYSVILA